jgi:hypothetical protein
VILSASVGTDHQQPDQDQHVVAVPQPGRKRQIHDSSIPTASTARRNQPPKLATSGTGSRSWRASIFSISVAVNCEPSADDDLALADRHVDRGDVCRCLGLGGIVRSELNDEFGDDEGRMSSAASIRLVVKVPRHQAGQSPRRTATSEATQWRAEAGPRQG